MRYELKARTIGEILDAAFTLYRNHFMELLQVALMVSGPLALLRLALVHGLTGVWALEATPAMGPSKVGLVSAITLPLMLIAYGVQHATLVSSISDIYLGRTSNPWQRTLSAMPAILWAGVMTGFAEGLGFLFFIVPGILLALRWALTNEIVIIEGLGASASMKRSGVLMKERGTKVGVLLLVVSLLTGGLVGGLALLMPAALKAVPLVPQIISLGLTILVSPLGPCVMTLAYFDARVEKEAFDLEVLATEMGKTQSAPRVVAPQG